MEREKEKESRRVEEEERKKGIGSEKQKRKRHIWETENHYQSPGTIGCLYVALPLSFKPTGEEE